MTCSRVQPGPATGNHTGQLQMHEVHRVSLAWNQKWQLTCAMARLPPMKSGWSVLM